MRYTIWTGGPVIEKTGTFIEIKKYVEKYAPLKKGWVGKWEKNPKRSEWRYRRYNSKGNLLANLDIHVTEGTMK